MTKQTTITIEARSLLVLHSRDSRSAWCPICGSEVETISLENTGVISNLERRALEDWLNSGESHRFKAPDGSVLLCLNSLLAYAQNQKTPNRGFPKLPKAEKERT
jgi:hypothetical protein